MKSKDISSGTKRIAEIWANYVNKIPNGFTEPPHTKPDDINHPTHYNKGGIETLDYIKAKTPHYESYAVGNIIKYVSRYQHKNGLEDLKKAQFYLNDLVEEMEKNAQQ